MCNKIVKVWGFWGVLSIAALIAFCAPRRAEAAAFFGFNFNVGLPAVYPAPVAPVVESSWAPGHYETRTQTVLVEPAHIERREVPAVVETRQDYRGRLYTVVVQPAYYANVRVPARYETREVQVWIPGYCADVAAAPVVVSPLAVVHYGHVWHRW